MTTMIRAHFDGRVFVPDEPVDVPTGTPATVQVASGPLPAKAVVPDERRPGESVFEWLARNAVDDDGLPADLSKHLDHYLYGSPKRPENV